MLPLLLLVLVLLALCHWALEPLVAVGAPLVDLSWLGWFLLIPLLWVFAVPTRR